MEEKIKKLEKIIGVDFVNVKLIQEAMTHRSYLNENRNYELPHNERLEFLGDAVLELSVTRFLFSNYKEPEGELTNWRASLVNGEMLSRVAAKLGIDEYILMSKGERKDLGKARQYISANAMESIIGAIYLDQGFEKADEFILKNIIVNLPEILESKSYLDAKSYFQEKAQETAGVTPHYEVTKEWGPDHDKKFKVVVFLEDEEVAEGEGRSKQDAQRDAADNGLEVKGWK